MKNINPKRARLFVRAIICILLVIAIIYEIVTITTENARIQALYDDAVSDASVAQQDEIMPLVTLTPADPMTTWNDEGEVLLVTWNTHPDFYKEGEALTLSYGPVWSFTDKEIIAWYQAHDDEMKNEELRLNQLIGMPENEGNTHFTTFWVSPDDVIRPAYQTDVTKQAMATEMPKSADETFVAWFDDNAEWSYHSETPYPWTRLGYTYDWADNGIEYGLSEFLVAQDAKITVEYTLSTEDFIDYMKKAA